MFGRSWSLSSVKSCRESFQQFCRSSINHMPLFFWKKLSSRQPSTDWTMKIFQKKKSLKNRQECTNRYFWTHVILVRHFLCPICYNEKFWAYSKDYYYHGALTCLNMWKVCVAIFSVNYRNQSFDLSHLAFFEPFDICIKIIFKTN